MIKLTYKILAVLLFVVSVYALISFRLLSLHPKTIPDLYNRKSLMVRQIPAPRIILIGGSNVLLGIDSDSLETKTGIPVINMGLNADLGLKFMTEFSKEYLTAGDIVIFSPEYCFFFDNNSYWGSSKLIDLIINNPDAATNIKSMEQMFYTILLSPAALISRSIYGADSYNPSISEKGDYLWNEISLQNKVKLPVASKINNSISIHIINDLISYRRFLYSRDIKLYLSFEYVPRDLFLLNKDTFDKLYRRLLYAGFNVLAPPEACTLSTHYFYDTADHLNAVGRILRTDQLAIDFKRHFEKSNELNSKANNAL